MTRMKKWLYLVAGGIGALALAAAVLILATPASAASPVALSNGVADMLHGGRGFARGPVGGGDFGEALADALGISVEELQEAQQTAHDAAIAQAVEEGLLTEEQAARIPGGRMPFGGGFHNAEIDMNALLADALGIPVDELVAAQEAALDAMIAQAVADGTITQEQADLIEARKAVGEYMADAFTSAYEEAIAQAAADGVISQEQADLLLENAGTFGGPGGMRGPGRFGGGRGGFPGGPLAPDSVQPEPDA